MRDDEVGALPTTAGAEGGRESASTRVVNARATQDGAAPPAAADQGMWRMAREHARQATGHQRQVAQHERVVAAGRSHPPVDGPALLTTPAEGRRQAAYREWWESNSGRYYEEWARLAQDYVAVVERRGREWAEVARKDLAAADTFDSVEEYEDPSDTWFGLAVLAAIAWAIASVVEITLAWTSRPTHVAEIAQWVIASAGLAGLLVGLAVRLAHRERRAVARERSHRRALDADRRRNAYLGGQERALRSPWGWATEPDNCDEVRAVLESASDLLPTPLSLPELGRGLDFRSAHDFPAHLHVHAYLAERNARAG